MGTQSVNNTMLMSHYLKMSSKETIEKVKQMMAIQPTTKENALGLINSVFEDWSMEVLSLERLEEANNSSVASTVVIYVPGMMKIGTSRIRLDVYSKGDAYDKSVSESIINAFKTLGVRIEEGKETKEKKEDVKEIKPQENIVDGYFPSNNEVPMNQGFAIVPNQTTIDQRTILREEQNEAVQMLYDERNAVPQQPVNKTNFTDEQIAEIEAIKNSNGITSREALLAHFRCWNPNLQTLKDVYAMNSQQMGEFLKWYKSDGPLNSFL